MQTEWIYGLGGGLMIGVAAALYLLVNGRIMGISGILGGAVDGTGRESMSERLWFMAGLIAAPAAVAWAIGVKETHLTSNLAVIVVAGVLVGIGTRLANGCTSGHGVCGISQLSLRAIVATVFYLLAGGISVLVFRQMLGVI